MNFIQKTKLAYAANGVVNAIGKLNFPQGAYATYIGAVILILTQFLTTSGDLFPSAWQPYVPPILAILTGMHTISALAWPGPGGWSMSAVWVVFVQIVGISVQTTNSLLPIAPPEWRPYVTDTTQVLMGLQTMTALRSHKS